MTGVNSGLWPGRQEPARQGEVPPAPGGHPGWRVTAEGLAAARRAWPSDEGTDFTVTIAQSADGTCWLVLSCSAHGNVMAASTAWDLGDLSLAAERHYARRHLGTDQGDDDG
jgi:hypothetical protein